jgi:tetratricopeptide (TPR) repeat protein
MEEEASSRIDQLFGRAVHARGRGEIEQARALTLEALQIEPGKARLWIELADCERELGRRGEALRALRKAEGSRPDSATVQVRIGAIQLELGRPRLAERALHRSLELEPRPVAHNLMFVALARQGREQQGEAHLRATLKLDPDNEEAHCNLGIRYRDRRQLARAEKHLRRAIKIDSRYQVAHAALGSLLLMQKQYAEARRVLRKAVRLEPEAYWARLYLAQANWQLSRFKEADEQYLEALLKRPEDSLGHALYGDFLSSRPGSQAEGERHLRTALMLDPRDAAAHYHIGKHLCGWGREREGISHLRKAVRHGDDRARSLLKRVEARLTR